MYRVFRHCLLDRPNAFFPFFDSMRPLRSFLSSEILTNTVMYALDWHLKNRPLRSGQKRRQKYAELEFLNIYLSS